MEVDISHQKYMHLSKKKEYLLNSTSYAAVVLAHTHIHTHPHNTRTRRRVCAHTHMYIVLHVISTHIIFLFQFYAQLFVQVWLASKNKVLRYIDEAELALNVYDTSTEDNVRISMLKLVLNANIMMSLYFIKCCKIIKN